MPYQINFGDLSVAKSVPAPKKGRKFRLAVLGDFSARANRGELESGDDLADRKTLTVDIDNLDEILERLAPKISIELPGSGNVELEFATMEDFHPDELYGKLDIFQNLAGLRQRLKTSSTFAKAAKEMRDLGLAPAQPAAKRHVKKKKARGSVIDAGGKLSDFARLVGQPTAPEEDATDKKSSLDAFLRRIVGPTLVKNKDPQQDKLVALADEAIGAMMREVLHHPDFQALESLWRSVDFLVRRVETDETLQIVLIDMTAEEFAADVSSNEELQNSALYKLLVEQPAEDARNGMYSAIIANYVFERTPPHADLLGRVAKIASAATAPFITSLASNVIDQKTNEIHELTRDAWDALHALPEAGYLGLALPRFLLRNPYGKSDPIDSFKFEEFTMQQGLSAMLWANPAVAVGLLLAETFKQQGDKMCMGTISSIGEMPFYYYTDKDGDQIALPCTERYLTMRTQEGVASQGFLPILAVKNSPEIRVGSFRAVGGEGILEGWWKANTPPKKEARPASAPAAPAEAAEDAAPADETPADPFADLSADASTDAPADAPADTGSADADLDALLASMSSDTPAAEPAADAPAATDDSAMDPDLAKLLAELG